MPAPKIELVMIVNGEIFLHKSAYHFNINAV